MKDKDIDIKRSFLEVFKRFFEPIYYNKKTIIKAVIPVVLSSGITIYLVNIFKNITNELEKGVFNENAKNLVIIFIVLSIINYIIIIITRNWSDTVLRPTFRKYFYKLYSEKFIFLDNNEVEKQGTGKLIAMIDKGFHTHADLLFRFFFEVLGSILTIVFSLIFIFLININYFLITTILFILVFILNFYVQKTAKIYRKERRKSNIEIMRIFVKILMSKFEILQNNKLSSEIYKIHNKLDINISLNEKITNIEIYVTLFVKLIIDGAKLGVILLFGIGFLNHKIGFGEFVSLISIVYILEKILNSFANIYKEFNQNFVEVEKLWDFFDTTPEIKGYETGNEFIHKSGNIELKNVDFGYGENKKIFKNFDLNVFGGKITAFVGNSGGGKTTIVKIISGYIKQDSGKVIVDGQDLDQVSLKSYYKNIGYLTQEPSVFDGTIIDNLTYALEKNNIENYFNSSLQEKIHEVIKLSKCEFIYDFPKGLETEIGERGVRLSGGQRQRLAIAKIMLKNPKIIILDEPTSALDSFSEENITKAMHNLFKNRTVIIIAHRLQTVKHADRIIVLENGKIVEEGNHTSLIHLKGVYKKMLDLQSGF